MPVISTRYSTTTTTGNSYISPSVGSYRSTLSATNRSSADRSASIERPNYTSATESYLNRARASSSSSFRLSTASSYRLTNGTSSSSDYSSSRYGKAGNAGTPHQHQHRHPRSSSCSAFRRQQQQQLQENNNSIMPSFTHSAPVQGSRNEPESKLKFTNLSASSTAGTKKVTTSIFNGNPNKRASFLPASSNSSNNGVNSSLNYRDENFLKKEYEQARNQVTTTKNLKNNNDQDTNNNMSVLSLTNGSTARKTLDEEKQELNEVRNKILSRVARNNANNAMLNGEFNGSDNGSDDIKFIDSDSDNLSEKRMSPLSNGGSLNNISATPNHITKMLAASTPINSGTKLTNNGVTLNKTNTYPPKPTKTSFTHHSSPAANNAPSPSSSSATTSVVAISPSNKKLILNASPKNSCVYEKQQQNKQNLLQKLSINNSEAVPCHNNSSSSADLLNGKSHFSNKMAADTKASVQIGSNRLRIITTDTDDDEDFTNVTTTATIILPSKAAAAVKQNGTLTTKSAGGDTIVANNHENAKDNSSDAPSNQLEKKNLANHKQLQSDTNDSSVRSASSLRSALPPSSASRSTWDKDTYRSTYSSRNYDNNDSSTSSSSYILPRSSLSTRSGSPGKDYESRKAEKENQEGLCGLWNIGNTCFMNSVLQCLSHTKELTRGIRALVPVRAAGKDQRIFTEFQKLIKELWTPGNRSVNPSEFKMAFSSKHRMYSGSAQQDSQEFLRFFLDSVHGALNTATKADPITLEDSMSDARKAELMWNWYSKTENSVIKDLFVGQLKSTLKCTECGNTSTTFDPFWDLSVSLPSNTRCKLSDCLDSFIKEEILDGDEMPTCSKCKTRRKSTKSFTIQRFPKILVIHLKRFSETRWSKLTTLVEFPTSEGGLNLEPYASSSNSDSSNGLYSLYATSNHMGSTAGGHYVAFCKHPVSKKWHEFNDNSVTDAPESSLVSSSAYLLFYERM
ncbi:ubiquitin carboxyl-terminal hydrolase Usp2 isoform X2 [Culicoides brevitarsis]|uniref:ubiquitin carboxyl-terminal hydrolase Usp2 isoform X2 n=1 Tax=Culicoides brevitarsis TaxID=469753 RepID=UPI00307C37BA